MADDANETAKKRVEQDKEVTEVSRREYAERSKGKPTPTQEENDLAAHGAHVTEKEDDGSGPDPHSIAGRKQSEAQKPSGGGYETRAAKPATPQPAQRSVPPRSE